MENKSLVTQPKDEMVIYQTEDGSIKLDVLFDNDTVWLSRRLRTFAPMIISAIFIIKSKFFVRFLAKNLHI